MKQLFNKYPTAVIAIGIIAIAGVITYQSTWNSKSWLIGEIMDNGISKDENALSSKSASELRKMLRS